MSVLTDQLQQVPEATRPIVQAAIRMVRELAPDAEEIAYEMAKPRSKSMVWKLVRYAVEGRNVVGIGTVTAHSHLFFYRGRELDDGSGLLKGGGMEMRFISLDSPEDVSRPEVKRMVRKAFQLSTQS